MPLGLDDPRWLLGLLLVPLVVLLGTRGAGVVRARQRRAATALRALGIAALVLALAGPRWSSAGDTVDVAFLVDASDSVGAARGAASAWMREALDGRDEADRAAVALFGREARLEHSLRTDPQIGELATVVDGSATDIARALRLGQGVLGSEHRRRVVLFSDGRATSGDAVAAAAELADSGVQVDVVPLASGRAADVLVEEVRAPNRVRQGESFDVVGVLRNTGSSSADVVVVVTADGAEIHREAVTAAPGATEVTVPQVAERDGTVRYEVRLSSGASSVPENDVGRAGVQVAGPPKVLVFEGETGAGDDLARALDAASVPADRLSADRSALPALDRLLDYDAVVLVDVPAAVVGEQGMIALDAFVRDAGHGLVAVGGDDAYGMGGYDGTPLEELLPVFARVKDPKRRPSVAEALVVDVSGSMAACHCRPDGFAGGPGMTEEGGVNKTDITKEAVARAVRALEAQDTVGVLAFNATAEWVLPLQHVPSDAIVDEALAKLRPDGPTDVVNALEEAIAGLKDVEARLRHIVLFTDGFSEDPRMVETARKAAENGITLSVVATGEGTGEVLRRMAEAGNGRYYPGRDLFSIPDIIVSEVQFAARPLINEGNFVPVVSGIDAPTEDLTATPPLLGYVATTAKPTARTLLQIGEERDPLLATWQAGLGQAVAWTSDATARWSSAWLSWERYATFWADVVKTTFPAGSDAGFGIEAVAGAEGLRVRVAASGAFPAEASGTAVVTAPDGTRTEVELQRTELGSFEAVVPGTAEGVYAVSARIGRNGADVHRDATTAIRSYSPEYAAGAGDPTALERIAAAGGGRLDPDPATAFDPTGLAPGSSARDLWPWFALLALLTLPADVGLRRLRLEREDLRRARAWLRRRGRRRRDDGPRSTATEGLLAARDRARERVTVAPGPDRDGDRPPAGPPRPAAPPPPPAATPPTAGPEPPPAARADEGNADGRSGGARGLLDARRRARRDEEA
jgi:Mg-chelatase subunit ChlD